MRRSEQIGAISKPLLALLEAEERLLVATERPHTVEGLSAERQSLHNMRSVLLLQTAHAVLGQMQSVRLTLRSLVCRHLAVPLPALRLRARPFTRPLGPAILLAGNSSMQQQQHKRTFVRRWRGCMGKGRQHGCDRGLRWHGAELAHGNRLRSSASADRE